MITVHYSTSDGHSETRRFKTLKAAQRYAHKKIARPDLGSYYAVSDYGDAKIEVDGVSIHKLYAEEKPVPTECMCDFDEVTGRTYTCDFCKLPSTIAKNKAHRLREQKKAQAATEKELRLFRAWEAFSKTGKVPRGYKAKV